MIAPFVFALLVISITSSPKLYYLHNQTPSPSSPELTTIIENQYKVPVLIIDCNQKNCAKYKAPANYPQLVYWNGPGCSYKIMETPSIESLHKYFERVNSNPIKPIRDFLERISLAEAFGVAFGLGTFLYIVFTYLFTSKDTLMAAQQKAKKQ